MPEIGLQMGQLKRNGDYVMGRALGGTFHHPHCMGREVPQGKEFIDGDE